MGYFQFGALMNRAIMNIQWKIPWRRKWQPTPVFLAGKSHGQMNLADYKSWDRRVRHDLTTKHLGLDLGTEKKTLMEKLRKLI